jgi:Tol biopolymer transport system component
MGQRTLKKQFMDLQKEGKLKILTTTSRDIGLLDVKTGNWKSVLERDEPYSVHHFTFFPDGSRGLHALPQHRLIGLVPTFSFLEVLALKSGHVSRLLQFADIAGHALSSDGTKIVFAGVAQVPVIENPTPQDLLLRRYASAMDHSLYLFDIPSRKLEKLVEKEGSNVPSVASWSPDGSKVLYQTTWSELSVYDFPTRSTWRVLEKFTNVSWSPDGSRIYYQHPTPLIVPKGDRNYYSIKPDGTGKELLLDNSKNEIGIPIIHHIGRIGTPLYPSPDGRFILFGRVRGNLEIHHRVYVMDLQTRKTVALGDVSDLQDWHLDWT